MDLQLKKLGQILKEAREEKKLSQKDVSAETNISLKYIQALEEENYSIFPGETFTLGFLKNYGSFLKLNSRMLIDLYRGTKIEESQAPIEELTRPTSSQFEFKKNILIVGFSIVILVLSAFLLYHIFFTESANDATVYNEESGSVNSEIPPEINFINQSVPDSESVPFILTSERGVSFSVSNQLCKIFIISVEKSDAGKKAVYGLNVFPEKKVYTFTSTEGDEKILSYKIPELSSLRRELRILTQTVTDKSARIMVTLSQENEKAGDKPIGNVPIQVTLYFLKPSYVEFIIDGQMGERGLIKAEEIKNLEANDRLEIKAGDGGAVEMVQNGKPRVKLGKSGKLVKKIFIKTPNPYDSTQYIIKELGE